MIERIDSFVAYDSSQLAEAEAIVADLALLTKEQAALVGEERVKTAEQNVEAVKAIEQVYILDSSKNAKKTSWQNRTLQVLRISSIKRFQMQNQAQNGR